ncbi:MAG TPA: hypothetical protein VF613_10475 [Longimicrobium sp.]|jgi:hypothetical protein
MSEDALRSKFPSLGDTRFRVTSPATGEYTCIGYAAGDADRVWLPDPWPEGVYYWPEGVPREHTIGAWTRVFESIGYRPCENRELERDIEKVAVYADARGPQHVARQLPNGRWTSKVGTMEDIEHELYGLEGASYGEVMLVLGRKIAGE